MKNLLHKAMGLMAFVFIVASCSPISVVTDMDKTADFTKHKTYYFLPWSEDNSSLVNQLDQKRLYDAVRLELNKRGYSEVKENGDLAINLLIILEKKTGKTAYTNHYNPGGYYGGYGYGYGGIGYGGTSTTYFNEYDYLKGTLIIDVFDHNAKKLIWQGAGVKTIEEGGSKNPEKATNKAVEAIMVKYPVAKKKSK